MSRIPDGIGKREHRSPRLADKREAFLRAERFCNRVEVAEVAFDGERIAAAFPLPRLEDSKRSGKPSRKGSSASIRRRPAMQNKDTGPSFPMTPHHERPVGINLHPYVFALISKGTTHYGGMISSRGHTLLS